MMCIKVQDLPLSQCLDKHLQYLQPLVTLCICVLISDAIIPNQLSFLVISFCDFESSFVYTKKLIFRCALCGNFTALRLLSLKKKCAKPFRKMQVCPELIKVRT